ncbi:MAG: T9SS type B sorting domain-containing protein, partial [Ferruginibacter sp.]
TAWTIGGTPVATPTAVNAAGVYQLIVTNGSGCADTATVTVAINPKPSLGVDKTTSICPNATVDLTAQFITSGLTTAWTFGGVPVANPLSVNTLGVYQLIATNITGCADTALYTISAAPAPVLTITNPPALCLPAVADLTAPSITNGSSTGLTFTYWNNLAATSAVANPSAVSAGTYYIKATTALGCTAINSVVVSQVIRPQVYAGRDTAICSATPGQLHGLVTGTSGTVSYAWTPNIGLNRADTLTAIATPDSTTTYTLTTTIVNGTCTYTVSDSMVLTVQPPVVANAGRDTFAVIGISHQLQATGGLIYSWTPTFVLNNPNIANPFARLTTDTRFVVRVSDLIGCFDYDTVFVKVYDAIRYYVPNAFSPNGDGRNDIFKPIPIGIVSTEYFRVYNRFGELVYQTSQNGAGWDGTFKGKPQPVGNYVWMVKGKGANSTNIELSGNVVLVR